MSFVSWKFNGTPCNHANDFWRDAQSIFAYLVTIFHRLCFVYIFSGCFRKSRPLGEPANCPNFSRYRLISGRCNNNRNSEWGSAGSTLRRFAPNAYSDGRGEPRGGRHPSSLPSPRWVSQKNHPDNDVPDARFTHMVMQFGQFLDHDITLTPKDGKVSNLFSKLFVAL